MSINRGAHGATIGPHSRKVSAAYCSGFGLLQVEHKIAVVV